MPSFRAVRWLPPPNNAFKLNTDGSSIGNPGPAGAGTIIRDHNGNWISGSHRYIGHASNSVAELWALRDGLQLAKDIGIELLLIEVDSTMTIASVTNAAYESNYLFPLIMDCRTLLDGFRVVSFEHVYREANACADKMARMGSNSRIDSLDDANFQDCSLSIYNSMPNFMSSVVSDDRIGLSMYRTI